MRLAKLFSTFACVAFLLPVLSVQAEDSVTDLSRWIKLLDSSKFGERELASRKLAEAGQSALEEVTKAASGESREVSTRAFQLLRGWKDGGSADLKARAKEALEKLARSDNKKIARRAGTALNPPAEQQAQAVPNLRPRIQVLPAGPGGGLRGRIQIRAQAIQILGGKGAKKIQIQNNNGVRKIDVTEGDKKIRIDDDPKGGIQIQVTEKVKGVETTKKYQAKDKDELKKKHPEIRKLFDKYAGNQAGGIQIGAQAFPALPGRIQQAIPLQKLIPGLPAQGKNAQKLIPGLVPQPQKAEPANPAAPKAVAEAQKELQAAIEQLKEAAAKDPTKLPELLKRVEAASKRLAEAQKKQAE